MSEPLDPTRNPQFVQNQEQNLRDVRILILENRIIELEAKNVRCVAALMTFCPEAQRTFLEGENLLLPRDHQRTATPTLRAVSNAVASASVKLEDQNQAGERSTKPSATNEDRKEPDSRNTTIHDENDVPVLGHNEHHQVEATIKEKNRGELHEEERPSAQHNPNQGYRLPRIVPKLDGYWHMSSMPCGRREYASAFNKEVIGGEPNPNFLLMVKDVPEKIMITFSNGIDAIPSNSITKGVDNIKQRFPDREYLLEMEMPDPDLIGFVDYYILNQDDSDVLYGLRPAFIRPMVDAQTVIFPVHFHTDENGATINPFRSCRSATCCIGYCYLYRKPDKKNGGLSKVEEVSVRCGFCDGGHAPENCTTFTTMWGRARAWFFRKRCWMCGTVYGDNYPFGEPCQRRGTPCTFCSLGDHHPALCVDKLAMYHLGCCIAVAQLYAYEHLHSHTAEDETFRKNCEKHEDEFYQFIQCNLGTGLDDRKLSGTNWWYKRHYYDMDESDADLRKWISRGVQHQVFEMEQSLVEGRPYTFVKWPQDSVVKAHRDAVAIGHSRKNMAIHLAPTVYRAENHTEVRPDMKTVRASFLQMMENDIRGERSLAFRSPALSTSSSARRRTSRADTW